MPNYPTLHLVNSQGGGKGKSLFTRVLAHHASAGGYAVQLMDADAGKRNIKAFYPNTLEIAMTPEQYWGVDAVLETLEQGLSVVLNLPAGANPLLKRWFEDDGVIDLKIAASTVFGQAFELDPDQGEPLRVVQWFLCDATPDSLSDFKQTVAFFDQQYPKRLHHILVRNYGLSPQVAWSFVDDTELDGLLKRSDIGSIIFANCPMRERDRLQSLQWPFERAIAKSTEYKLAERQRIVTFLKKTLADIDSTGLWKNEPIANQPPSGDSRPKAEPAAKPAKAS